MGDHGVRELGYLSPVYILGDQAGRVTDSWIGTKRAYTVCHMPAQIERGRGPTKPYLERTIARMVTQIRQNISTIA